jgi:hypothetical protein
MMSTASILSSPVWQPGEETSLAEDNSLRVTRKYHVAYAYQDATLPIKNRTRHPERPSLVCSTYTAVRTGKADIVEVTVTFKGPSPNTFTGGSGTTGGGGSGDSGDPQDAVVDDNSSVSISTQAVEIDVQNSPKFTAVAGTPLAPLRGARFDAEGLFLGFGPDAPEGLRGQKSYFVGETTLTLSFSTTFQVAKPTPQICTWNGYRGLRIGFTSILQGGVWSNSETILVSNNISPYFYD